MPSFPILSGRMPDDSNRLLKIIDDYFALTDCDRLIFSFKSRLMSFPGQYRGLTENIRGIIAPYGTDKGNNLSTCSDDTLESIIRMIRSRLMP